MYKYAVIGKGMIGSAAARYLSQASDSVVLIGPDEPQGEWAKHNGVFASHYDQGRITRALDSKIEWALWAQRSIDAYAELEAKSGIRFYHPCSGIQVGLAESGSEGYIPKTEAVAMHLGTEYQRYSGAEFAGICPELSFSDKFAILHEPTIAGYVNPRSLVAAQVEVAEKQGAAIVRETAINIEPQAGAVTITTDGGQSIQAEKVLVAAGAWTEFLIKPLTDFDMGVIPTPRTILLAKLDAAEIERLKGMPSIIFYEGLPNPHLSGVYILPPIQYPDGYTYIKIGGRMYDFDVPQSADELQEWFHGDGSKIEAQQLEEDLFSIVKDLRAESLITRPCMVTNQKDGLPVFEEIVAGQVVVATAGCGAGAKSSNELGRIAAVKLRRD